MTQSHYSLKWNNHQNHILTSFETLLHSETLVDVTLVCADARVRAHKVVLSACSPLFQRLFAENPCKHPVLILTEYSGWEIQAIVDFMYRGEISVLQPQLQGLIRAAEKLQIKGLANEDSPFSIAKNVANRTPPTDSPNDYDQSYFQQNRYPTPGTTARSATDRLSPARLGNFLDTIERTVKPHPCSDSPFSPSSASNYDAPPSVKLPRMSRISFPDTLLPRQDCQSPVPRRKQARPRRRSGESCGAQDLSTHVPRPSPNEEAASAENLCMKKEDKASQQLQQQQQQQRSSSVKSDETVRDCPPEQTTTPEMDLGPKEYHHHQQQQHHHHRTSPNSLQQQHPSPINLKQEMENHSLAFPPMPTVSALAMTPPHSKFFGLDSPLGLFPPGLEGCRNPLFDISDHRTPDPQMFAKKKSKLGRPKGQHSAPRGGPPRSWTNAELTEALQHVWNKKMTTSQASRIFGIPYNSLLMYVRGKYGKSLKLEQLRKDCIAGPNAQHQQQQAELLSIATSNNNNNTSGKGGDREEAIQPNTRPPSTEEPQPPPPHHFMSPFMHNFYPDFGTGFPIPVSMIHLLPQSEKNRPDHYGNPPQNEVLDCKKELLDEEQELFKSPALSVDDRRELVQQNGQD